MSIALTVAITSGWFSVAAFAQMAYPGELPGSQLHGVVVSDWDQTQYAKPTSSFHLAPIGYAGCGAGSSGGCCQCNSQCRPTLRIRGPRELWYSDQHYFQYEAGIPCPGEATYEWLNAQVANGKVAQLAFYGFHFRLNPQTGGWEFTQSGMNKVYELTRILPTTSGTIIVSPVGDEFANSSCVRLVQESLASAGFTPQIAIGNPGLQGLNGLDSLRAWELRQQGSPFLRQQTTSQNSSRNPSSENGGKQGNPSSPSPIGR
jgi:hypothetical protein